MVSLPQAVDKGIAFADGRNLPVPSMHFVHISAPRAALQAVALRNGACGRTSGDLNGAKSDAHVVGFCIEFFSRCDRRESPCGTGANFKRSCFNTLREARRYGKPPSDVCGHRY